MKGTRTVKNESKLGSKEEAYKFTSKKDFKSSRIPSRVVFLLLATLGIALMVLAFTLGYVAKVVWSQNKIAMEDGQIQGVEEESTDVPKDSKFKSYIMYKSDKLSNEEKTEGDTKLQFTPALPAGIRQHLYFDFRNMDETFLSDEDHVREAADEVIRGLFLFHDKNSDDDDGIEEAYSSNYAVGDEKEDYEDDEEEDDDDQDESYGEDGDNLSHRPLEMKRSCSSNNANGGVVCITVFRGAANNDAVGNGGLYLYTFPKWGVMTIDLLYVPSSDEIDVAEALDEMKEVFGVPDTDINAIVDPDGPSPAMEWGHWYRGHNSVWDKNPDASHHLARSKDLGQHLSGLDDSLRMVVASVETPFQHIDIVDSVEPRYQSFRSYYKSLQKDKPSYESEHPELFLPHRDVFLDGVLQSTRHGDEAYHEALVHPGMLAHENPKRAAIIGGGEGATLREILRHDTIEHVKMIEIDGLMVNTSRTYLPQWNSCADIYGSTPNCFDEPRADVRIEDALAWFINRFGPKVHIPGEEKFDVVIMDALDPQDNVAFASALYSNDDFTASLYNSLTSDGVLIMQLGEVPLLHDLPDEYSRSHMRASLEQDLIRFGFKSLHQYEEADCDFDLPWSYIVAFKSEKTRKHWYENESMVNMKIRERIRPRIDPNTGFPVADSGPLRYVDGVTMARYQVPHKAFEIIFCRSPSAPRDTCAPISSKPSQSLFHLPPTTWNIIKKSSAIVENLDTHGRTCHPVGNFVEAYGTKTEILGETSYVVSADFFEKSNDYFCYLNEDCMDRINGTTTIADHDELGSSKVFNPALARRLLLAVATA